MHPQRHIIIFTRFPVPGKTKTRLIPSLGPKRAAELQQKMTEKVAREALIAGENLAASVSIFYTDGTNDQMTEWLGDCFQYYPQSSGDIGMRMEYAFSLILQNTVSSAILIGSDIPGITAEIIEKGMHSLQNSDAVVGPSIDGGYYLIGMNQNVKEKLKTLLFAEISWSTSEVLNKTIQRLNKSECSYALLQSLQDIDRPEDLSSIEDIDLI
ncbi:MAG: TIGR04282 family arsenosugar biosynthesis glycosyltransferase [Desulfotalea sp.]